MRWASRKAFSPTYKLNKSGVKPDYFIATAKEARARVKQYETRGIIFFQALSCRFSRSMGQNINVNLAQLALSQNSLAFYYR